MTKKQELTHFRSLIKTLGPDSYLGTWLQEVAGQVEQMVTSDIFPDILPNDCAKIVKENMESCKKDCDGMRERAMLDAKNITDAAIEQQKRIREAAKMVLQRAINEI